MIHEANIRRVFDLADRIDLEEGMKAYRAYQQTMAGLAGRYGCTLEQATAVFVSLSPNNAYLQNLRSAATVLAAHRAGIPKERVITSTYNHCRDRAFQFLDGADFLSATKGPKIRAFYSNIVNPSDPEPVTIDGHMIGVWFGHPITMKSAAYLKVRYHEIAGGFRDVAAGLGLIPNQLQAVLWFTWKRINRVAFDPRLSLFGAGNQWRNYIPAEEIKTYPVRAAA